MTKRLRTFIAFSSLLVSTLAIPAFGGQQMQPLRVEIPFPFTAGKTVLPAGTYFVAQRDMHVVTLEGNGKLLTVVGVAGKEGQDTRTSLSFERSNKGYVLKSVNNGFTPATVLHTIR